MKMTMTALRIRRHVLVSILVSAGVGLCVESAFAQSTIRNPGARPRYAVELEPHVLLGPFGPRGRAGDDGFGVGLRATLELVPNGFIASVNDSVGLGFGADFMRYSRGDARGECTDFTDGPNGTDICVEVDGAGGDRDRVLLPVVMQWNFWLARSWSVFGEPGLFLSWGDDLDIEPVALFVGGRYHASDNVALTLRIGYPTLSFGVSFLF